MNSKRRAELQRKLSMGAVPRPPADLVDRIKADIPNYLQVEAERARFTGSVAFSMRVAASILMLITTAFVTLRVLEPETKQTASLAARPQVVPAITRYRTAPTGNAARAQEPPAEEVRLDIEQDAIAPTSNVAPPAAPAPARIAAPTVETPRLLEAAPQVADRRDDGFADDLESKDEAAATGAVSGGTAAVAEKRAETEVADARERTAKTLGRVAEETHGFSAVPSAPAVMAPAPAPVAAMPAPPPPPSFTITQNAPIVSNEVYASELSLEQKPEVFGISVDPNVFRKMKSAIETGNRPPAGSVNVDALVNYFAGPPARAPRRGVALEVEASPAPIEAEGDQAILRFTVDTARAEVRPHASTPPAVVDARIEVEIDPKAVASFRRIGNNAPVASESTLLQNLSVTGLYQLELKPGLKESQHVATVRLRYRSIADGKMHVITHEVHGSDLARDWSRASRRHRLASLGAVWSESLKNEATRSDVARRAEELATQEPKDSRARELANAASATSGGKR